MIARTSGSAATAGSRRVALTAPARPLREWIGWLTSRGSAAGRARYAEHLRQQWERRELARLEQLPRYQPSVTDVTGQRLELVDGPSFGGTYREIYRQGIYAFRPSAPRPYIIDGGANIGMSVLYWKRLAPASEIVAFEPDPAIFAVLERNVRAAGHRDVRLVPRALWSADTTLSFLADGADGGRVAQEGEGTVRVETARLRDYLDRPVELLKLDIEGAETEVLQDCADRLSAVARLYVEYHSLRGQRQLLPDLLALLRDAGFRLHVQSSGVAPQPFLEGRDHPELDLQLHVFGVRE